MTLATRRPVTRIGWYIRYRAPMFYPTSYYCSHHRSHHRTTAPPQTSTIPVALRFTVKMGCIVVLASPFMRAVH